MACVKAPKTEVSRMKATDNGNILLIPSLSGLEAGSPPTYTAAKAGLIRGSRIIFIQLVPKIMRVNIPTSGLVKFKDGLWELIKTQKRSLFNWALNSALSRRPGILDEICKAVTFIISPLASWEFAFVYQQMADITNQI